MTAASKPAPVDEQAQRLMNLECRPWCMTDCGNFEYVYGTTPACNATEPRTLTEYTGRCICPKLTKFARIR